MSDKNDQSLNPPARPTPISTEIQIDRVHYKVTAKSMTGLQLRGVPKSPIGVDRDLFQVIPGGTDRKIGDNDVVDIRDGLRFFTAPAQINPGKTPMLPVHDAACLAERGIAHTVSMEANMTCVVLRSFRLPHGYDREHADLLLRLSPGFPDVAPDMWWFDPAIRLSDGRQVKATEITEHHLGRAWQRWSRHLSSGQWQSGTDSLESFLALIKKELERCVQNPN